MITTPGADPTQELEDYANRVMSGKYKQLAMGGQTMRQAVAMLHEATEGGVGRACYARGCNCLECAGAC